MSGNVDGKIQIQEKNTIKSENFNLLKKQLDFLIKKSQGITNLVNKIFKLEGEDYLLKKVNLAVLNRASIEDLDKHDSLNIQKKKSDPPNKLKSDFNS